MKKPSVWDAPAAAASASGCGVGRRCNRSAPETVRMLSLIVGVSDQNRESSILGLKKQSSLGPFVPSIVKRYRHAVAPGILNGPYVSLS
jgi:hypothetical protein